MKHEYITPPERDLTQWGRTQSLTKQSQKEFEMLQMCNDSYAIEIAEEIALRKSNGENCDYLESKLAKELTRMMGVTRAFLQSKKDTK